MSQPTSRTAAQRACHRQVRRCKASSTTANKVFVYDRNYPDQEKCLSLDLAARKICYDGPSSPQWSSYFVTGCGMEGPRPPYLDLGLQQGVTLQVPEQVTAGGRVAIDVC